MITEKTQLNKTEKSKMGTRFLQSILSNKERIILSLIKDGMAIEQLEPKCSAFTHDIYEDLEKFYNLELIEFIGENIGDSNNNQAENNNQTDDSFNTIPINKTNKILPNRTTDAGDITLKTLNKTEVPSKPIIITKKISDNSSSVFNVIKSKIRNSVENLNAISPKEYVLKSTNTNNQKDSDSNSNKSLNKEPTNGLVGLITKNEDTQAGRKIPTKPIFNTKNNGAKIETEIKENPHYSPPALDNNTAHVTALNTIRQNSKDNKPINNQPIDIKNITGDISNMRVDIKAKPIAGEQTEPKMEFGQEEKKKPIITSEFLVKDGLELSLDSHATNIKDDEVTNFDLLSIANMGVNTKILQKENVDDGLAINLSITQKIPEKISDKDSNKNIDKDKINAASDDLDFTGDGGAGLPNFSKIAFIRRKEKVSALTVKIMGKNNPFTEKILDIGNRAELASLVKQIFLIIKKHLGETTSKMYLDNINKIMKEDESDLR